MHIYVSMSLTTPWATWQQGRGKPKGRERVEFCLNSFHFVSFFSLSPQAISVAKEIVAIHTVFSYNRVRNPSNRTPRRWKLPENFISSSLFFLVFKVAWQYHLTSTQNVVGDGTTTPLLCVCPERNECTDLLINHFSRIDVIFPLVRFSLGGHMFIPHHSIPRYKYYKGCVGIGFIVPLVRFSLGGHMFIPVTNCCAWSGKINRT
ncbi:hypothetical protein YC2023_095551 [Brassica napus]